MDRTPEMATAGSLDDLLCASGRGDRDAFSRLYQLSAARLYPVAVRLLRRRDAAEDVLQEAYLRIWRNAGQYSPERGRPMPWMAAIVRNCALDRLAAETRQPGQTEVLDDVAESLADPLALLAAAAAPEVLAIRRCLDALNEQQRSAILLAYYHGLTHDELAVRLAAPLGTVKSWVRRGLLQLKGCLEQ